MAAVFKKGDSVRQIVKPIEGEVKRFGFDEETGKISYIVGFTDESGEHEVAFGADQLEAGTPKSESN